MGLEKEEGRLEEENSIELDKKCEDGLTWKWLRDVQLNNNITIILGSILLFYDRSVWFEEELASMSSRSSDNVKGTFWDTSCIIHM